MLVGAIVAFLFIFGLFLSMLSTSPKSQPDVDWNTDSEVVQELHNQGAYNT